MIAGFNHRGLKRLYERGDRRKVSAECADKLDNILLALDNALVIEALELPGFRLHALKGDLKGFWSISVRANWRVIFRFQDGKAHDVDLMDYHQQKEVSLCRCSIPPIRAESCARSASKSLV